MEFSLLIERSSRRYGTCEDSTKNVEMHAMQLSVLRNQKMLCRNRCVIWLRPRQTWPMQSANTNVLWGTSIMVEVNAFWLGVGTTIVVLCVLLITVAILKGGAKK